MWSMDTMKAAPGNPPSEPKRLVALTGAGISVDSGLKPFRGHDGLWEDHRIEDVATPVAWKRDPARVHRFYNERRAAAAKAKPNDAHLALASLDNRLRVDIITQNVDDLHERAGSAHILHLHGMLRMARSAGPDGYRADVGAKPLSVDSTSPAGYPLRPDVVWFGEAVPAMEDAVALVRKADVVLVIGTSLNVYPAAGLLFETSPGVPVFYIDPDPNLDAVPRHVTVIAETAASGLSIFIQTHLPHVLRT